MTNTRTHGDWHLQYMYNIVYGIQFKDTAVFTRTKNLPGLKLQVTHLNQKTTLKSVPGTNQY